MTKRRIVVAMLVLVGVVVSASAPTALWSIRFKHEVERREARLGSADLSEIKSECRALMQLMPGTRLSPQDARLPKTLRNLDPSTVYIDSDIVQIEMGGGFHHFGLVVAHEGSGASGFARERLRKLAEGVWHYSDQ